MNKKVKYVLKHDLCVVAAIDPCIVFENDIIRIDKFGVITIKKGFAWDGCSPKFRLFGRLIGTPDTQETYIASCVHDALYLSDLKGLITREEVDEIFYFILQSEGFKFAGLYYTAVKVFGGIYWKTGERI